VQPTIKQTQSYTQIWDQVLQKRPKSGNYKGRIVSTTSHNITRFPFRYPVTFMSLGDV